MSQKTWWPHKDIRRSIWFYAQKANLYRRGKSASFSISLPVTVPNCRDWRRIWLVGVQRSAGATEKSKSYLFFSACFSAVNIIHLPTPR